jgi:NAD-dependent deacetylase
MNTPERDRRLDLAARLVKEAQSIVALTGAGISTPSGIPDFRSPNTGLWERANPMEVASLTAFRRKPEVFYNWLRPLAQQIETAQPNLAHNSLALLEKMGKLNAVITQNIDGLHQKAGSKQVIEVHGSAAWFTCLHCHRHFPLEAVKEPFLEKGLIPVCPYCEGKIKPDIVLFEEMLPADAWRDAVEACRDADLILVIGSSLEVYPAASLPLYTLDNAGKMIINTYSETFLDEKADILLPLDVSYTLPVILERLPG